MAVSFRIDGSAILRRGKGYADYCRVIASFRDRDDVVMPREVVRKMLSGTAR